MFVSLSLYLRLILYIAKNGKCVFQSSKSSNTVLLFHAFQKDIRRNIGENIFRSYTGITSENTDFHVLVA